MRPKRIVVKRLPATSSQVSLRSIPKPPGVQQSVPKVTFMAEVEYPAAALAARQTGNVTVTVKLASSGKVTAAKLFRSSGHRLLDKAGVKAAKSWRFSPGDDGRTLRIVIPFRIVER